jgi:hypothetical protein
MLTYEIEEKIKGKNNTVAFLAMVAMSQAGVVYDYNYL